MDNYPVCDWCGECKCCPAHNCEECKEKLETIKELQGANLKLHECDDNCICPIHKTPLFYAPISNIHACQDVECIHGHGMVHQCCVPGHKHPIDEVFGRCT